MTQKYIFKARIMKGIGGGAWIEFPHDVRKEFGTGGRVPVKVTFDGEPYRGSLVHMGGPCHIIGILKSIRERLGKDVGKTVSVILEKDTEERMVEVPAELQAALKKNPAARSIFEKMSYSHRKEWARYVGEAKAAETRLRRAKKAVPGILKTAADRAMNRRPQECAIMRTKPIP
jgi:hypothetical protein